MSEQNGAQSQLELKSSSSSTAGSDDSLDKSDLDENLVDSQDHYKSFRSTPIILELSQKIGSDRSAFVRHATPNSHAVNLDNSRESPLSIVEKDRPTSHRILEAKNMSPSTTTMTTTNENAAVENQPPQPQKKKNPYSIEELLKKDESKSPPRRPRMPNIGVVQPCGIVVSKEI